MKFWWAGLTVLDEISKVIKVKKKNQMLINSKRRKWYASWKKKGLKKNLANRKSEEITNLRKKLNFENKTTHL